MGDNILQEVFFDVAEISKMCPSDFRFDPPELSSMTGRIGLLSTEGRTKGIDLSISESKRLDMKLTRDGKVDIVLAEELFRMFPIGSDLECLSFAFAVIGSD